MSQPLWFGEVGINEGIRIRVHPITSLSEPITAYGQSSPFRFQYNRISRLNTQFIPHMCGEIEHHTASADGL